MRLATCLLASALSTGSHAKSASENAAASGLRAWTAMTCSNYAAFAGIADEQVRLEQLGVSEGRLFLMAARNGAIAKQDFDSTVPMAFYGRMTGPSVDFALGRVSEAAQDYVGDKIWEKSPFVAKNDYAYPNEATIKERAQIYYDNENCKSLR